MQNLWVIDGCGGDSLATEHFVLKANAQAAGAQSSVSSLAAAVVVAQAVRYLQVCSFGHVATVGMFYSQILLKRPHT
jgi:diphthamide biosynthesis methyltransferase